VIGANGVIKATSDFDIYLGHGILMWLAWGVFGFVQILSNRYLRKHWKYAMLTHRISATLILLISISSSIFVIQNNGWKLDLHTHGMFGAFASTCVVFISVGGFLCLTLL
jgi:hypothetical protein